MSRKKNDAALAAVDKTEEVKEPVENTNSITDVSENNDSNDESETETQAESANESSIHDGVNSNVDLMDFIDDQHTPSTLFQDGESDPKGVEDEFVGDAGVSLRVKRLPHAGAQKDIAYQTVSAAGLDLYAAIPEEMKIKPGGRVQVPTGLAMEIPLGYEGQVRPRSSLAWNDGITVVNSPGTIDADYRGEVKVLLLNTSNNTYRVQPGDRIAQLVIAPVMQVRISYVNELSDTHRGAGGFGSTGK